MSRLWVAAVLFFILILSFWISREPLTLEQRVRVGELTPRASCQPDGDTYGKVWVCAEVRK